MGSPKIQKQKIPPSKNLLKAPEVGEKLELLTAARKLSVRLTMSDMPVVLERFKDAIMPVIPWLDKPYGKEGPFNDHEFPTALSKLRGVALFTRRSKNFPAIALDRDGIWFLKRGERYLSQVDSEQLSEIIKAHDLELALMCIDKKVMNLVSGDERLLALATQHSLIWLMAQFVELVEKQLKEKEERLRLVRAHIDLASEFSRALDPLVASGMKLPIPMYSIFSNHETGVGCSRHCGNYLCESALKPHWKKAEQFTEDYRRRLRPEVENYSATSIGGLLWRIESMTKDVSMDPSGQCERFPVSPQELVVARRLARVIRPCK